MIIEKKIDWINRVKMRNKLKKCGFISQNIITKMESNLSMEEIRTRLIKNNVIVIKLNTDNAITYWYPKNYKKYIV